MIDIGVARPRAQGQAMISTEIAARSAWASAGGGPKAAQARKASPATAMTAGTNQAATASARPWTGARERWASATMATMRARVVSRADAAGDDDEAAGAVEGGAGDRVAGGLLDRHRLAGQHALVDGGAAFENLGVDRDPGRLGGRGAGRRA